MIKSTNRGQTDIFIGIFIIVIIIIIVGALLQGFSQQSKIDKLTSDLSICNSNLNKQIQKNSELDKNYADCQQQLTEAQKLIKDFETMHPRQLVFNISSFVILLITFIVVIKPTLFKIKFDGSALIEKIWDWLEDLNVGWLKYVLITIFILLLILFIITLILVFIDSLKLFLFKLS